ncbi:hypothetical protein CBW58_22870 [Yersinia frederiksenii]|nr:hypothetical protein CBW58_22870 [Yersinia frederiksenii]
MNPSEFIRKHIVAALVADGVPDVVARGGQMWVLSIIASSLRQAVRVQLLTIAYGKRVYGFSSIVRKRSEKQARKNRQKLHLKPVCFDYGDINHE